jgi:hypothetical protein
MTEKFQNSVSGPKKRAILTIFMYRFTCVIQKKPVKSIIRNPIKSVSSLGQSRLSAPL